MIKVLIVEDEAGIRNSIVNAFYWDEWGCEVCGAAESGIEALELCLKNPPDIIITDIVMPGIDGLTFLKYIKEKYRAIRFIILTGHRDFDYAKDALNLGAAFFMLKPIVYEELYQAVGKLAEEIRNERKGGEAEYQEERILRDLFSGRVYSKGYLGEQMQKVLEKLNTYCVAVMEFDDSALNDSAYTQSIFTFCKDLMANDNVIPVKLENQKIAFLMPLSGISGWTHDAIVYFGDIQQRIHEFFHFTVSIGLSSQISGENNMRKGYLEATRAVSERFFSGKNSINLYDPERGKALASHAVDFNEILAQSQKIKELARHTDPVMLSKMADEIFNRIVRRLANRISMIKSTTIIILTLGIKMIFSEDSRQFVLLFEKYLNFQNILDCETVEDLRTIFINAVLDLSDYVNIKKGSNKQIILDRVINYIGENYSTNISLNDIAKLVYFSPSYLSTLIANEMGKTFIEMLTEFRIEKAMELLKDTRLKNFEIARRVGFNEPQYFSLAFKKYTGLSPSDYRKLYISDSL